MAKTIGELTPFVRLSPDGTIYFDAGSAASAKLSAEMVRMGKEYENYHNGLLASVMRAGIRGASPNAALKSKFEPFFRNVARTGNILSADSARAVGFAGTSPLQMACGGGMLAPHAKKDRKESNIYKNTMEELEAHLLSLGYHRTAPPGCGPGVDTCSDFTKWVDAYGCTRGAFRMQAVTRPVGSKWTYTTQGPEPNPEIMSYAWPVYWWGPYVAWWHARY